MKKTILLLLVISAMLLITPVVQAKGGGSGGVGGGSSSSGGPGGGSYYGGDSYDYDEDYDVDHKTDAVTKDNKVMSFFFSTNGDKYITRYSIEYIVEDYNQSYIINHTDMIEKNAKAEYEDYTSDEYFYGDYRLNLKKIGWYDNNGTYNEKNVDNEISGWDFTIVLIVLIFITVFFYRKR